MTTKEKRTINNAIRLRTADLYKEMKHLRERIRLIESEIDHLCELSTRLPPSRSS